jgi:hypothetical protein
MSIKTSNSVLPMSHKWGSESCSCGSDTCLCQVCGRVTCGLLCQWVKGLGNVCHLHPEYQVEAARLHRIKIQEDQSKTSDGSFDGTSDYEGIPVEA